MTHRSSSQLTGGNGNNAAVPVPSGAAVGDIAVVGIYKESTAAVTPPSGFNQKVALSTSAGTRGALYVFWKRLTAADSGTYSFTWSGNTYRAAECGLWSGRVTTGDPFDGFGTAESTSGVSTLNVSASPAAAGGDGLGFWTNFNGGANFSPPSGWTERQETSFVICLDTLDNMAAGDTGNLSATATVSDFMKAFLGVLAADAGGGTTPVGKDLGLQWDTRAALGDTAQAVWDVRAAVGDTVQALWDVRQAVGDPVALQWDARALATKSVQALWDVRATIGDPVQLVWDTRAAVSDEVQLLWDVQSALASVGKDLGLRWDTRARLGDPLQIVWDVRAAVGDPLQAIWDTRAVAARSVELTWDLRSVLGDELALIWAARAAVGDIVQALWNVRATIGDPLALLWNIESTVPPRDITVISNIRSNHVTGGVRLSDLVAGLRSNHITGGVEVSRSLRTGSVEYVTAEVTFVGETAASIATATGLVQITTSDTTPADNGPNWVNPDVTTRTDVTGGAKLSLSKLHTAGAAATYRLWAKVTDNPEIPILLCGSFIVHG